MWRVLAIILLGFALLHGFAGFHGFAGQAPGPKADQLVAQPLTLQVQNLKQQVTFFSPQAAPPQTATTAAIPPKKPAVVVLHSGFLGDDAVSAVLARELARRGIFIAMPSYRGERRRLDKERSEGRIEFCSGEVDDAQETIAWLRRRDDVDPNRIALIGMSHGGCVALRTAIREPRLRAVVTLSAAVAAEPLVEHLYAEPHKFFLYDGILAAQLVRYIGGSPELIPDSYAVRSPLYLAGKLTMPLMIIHGSTDSIVPPQQACWLAQVLARSGRDIRERWLDAGGKELLPPPALCELKPEDAAKHPEPQAPHTELWLVKGQDHIFFSPAARSAAHAKAIEFLVRELTQ